MKTEIDGAAVFAICMSLRDFVRDNCDNNMTALGSEGAVDFMAAAGHLAIEFSAWAEENVDFDEWGEVWPYHLDEHFAKACVTWVNSLEDLSAITKGQFPAIACLMGCPLKKLSA